ncbi:phosphatase PAP2 family protein [Streptomyces antarcticus]|uniref:phosphatase PAP2 family protein n=1 Tax=Streptomyces antarcticus TaxID=2996458 RepID=UPI00226D8D70|nr:MULTISPECIES: phosphatase PAP2 family protein [unclassified Streptomyces]MCY0939787.1 phosphatase PAP2 family protein [Streptomyces sp. H34-AA3]MCZ4080957.1 phosphatase PAP2 family protein [Streptomyces sp. H34-S5]
MVFTVIHLTAVWTPIGQAAENSLVRGYADHARISTLAWSWGPPPLTGEWATLIGGTTLIVVVAALRRRRREGCAALATVLVTLAVTEFLSKVVLIRPDLVSAPQPLLAPSFPSGHVGIVAALSLGCALVTPARGRPYVAAVGAAWTAVIAGGVQSLYWHRPSDVLGATLLACACHGIAARLLSTGGVPATPRPRALVPLAVASVGALLAGSRDDALGRPMVFAAAAFACAVLVWATVFATPSTAPVARARRR